MKFYYVRDMSNASYQPTLTDAHRAAKKLSYFDACIEEVEVPTDKAGVLRLLNAETTNDMFTPLRTWVLTHRGGLKEAGGEVGSDD